MILAAKDSKMAYVFNALSDTILTTKGVVNLSAIYVENGTIKLDIVQIATRDTIS